MTPCTAPTLVLHRIGLFDGGEGSGDHVGTLGALENQPVGRRADRSALSIGAQRIARTVFASGVTAGSLHTGALVRDAGRPRSVPHGGGTREYEWSG